MALIKSIQGISPKIDPDCFIAENATIIGDAQIGTGCSIWYNATIRADVNKIVIGQHTNIQDGAVIHCTYQKFTTQIGSQVSVGHNAIVHGCVIEDHVLIGMGAIVMDGAHIKKNSIVAAGSIVKEGTIVESGTLYAGNPAVFKKSLNPTEIQDLTDRLSKNYKLYSSWQ